MGAVVVGFVPKPEGRAALASAVEEARRRRATLIVVSSPASGGSRLMPGSAAQRETDLESEIGAVDTSGVEIEVRALDRVGDPAEGLVTAARSSGAEVLVIGLRRRTPVGKLILGSSAQRILLDAPCPVLAVKA